MNLTKTCPGLISVLGWTSDVNVIETVMIVMKITSHGLLFPINSSLKLCSRSERFS